jgi:DNA-binding PadR family transcriptional regulator
MFFLESSLLVLLLREPGYGYSLMNGLQEFGFRTEQIDVSIIYRALRDLEGMDLVSDIWDDKSLGPPRRVYTITSAGRMALDEWIDNLRQDRQAIEALEAAYEETKRQE